MQEIWKPIIGYENLYEVSNLGNVRSLDRTVKCHSKTRLVKGKLLNQALRKNGYYTVTLCDSGRDKQMYVHRLVALHFVENPKPDEYNVINHKDENRKNNIYTNLEWCTPAYNLSYGTAQQRANDKKRGVFNTKHSKPVEGYDDNGNVLYSFPSLMEAHRHGFDFRLVSACCLGKRSFHKGLHWRFSSNA